MSNPEMAPSTKASEKAQDDLEALYDLPAIADSERNQKLPDNLASSPEQIDSTPLEPRSALAGMLRRGTERIANFLDDRAATKDERQAARSEKLGEAKLRLQRIGRGALRGAKNAGIVALELGVMTAEASMNGAETTREKVIMVALAARKRLDERAAYRENHQRNVESQNAAYDSYSENITHTQAREAQDEAFATYEPNVAYSQAHEEALGINDQKKVEQEAAYSSYEGNIETTEKRENQEAAFVERYSENIDFTKILERRRLALERKQLRKAQRSEMYGNLRLKGSELFKKAAGHTKRFGRAALRALKRTANAGLAGAKAAGSAAKTSWQQS